MTRKSAVERLAVYRGDEFAGQIERTARGARFAYDTRYREAHEADPGPLAGAIALHLPLRAEPHEIAGTNLHPFFANLLPEGARYAALLGAVKTSPEDLLSLLAAAGEDCVGDIAVVCSEDPPRPTRPTLDLARVAEASFNELLRQSLNYAGQGEQHTTPGVQEKISAAMISVPIDALAGEAYLLKLEPQNYPRIVQNEAFFMGLARDAGIDTAEVSVLEDRDGTVGLLVRRFDRTTEKLHVEDGCQLLDRYPADKYAVSLAEVASAIAAHSSTAILDVANLIRLAAFSQAIANGDLHAKNVSLLLNEDRASLRLSPAYDLLTTLPYGDTSMALPLDGRDKKLRRSHFVTFAERFGVRAAATRAILDEVCHAVQAGARRVGVIGFADRKTTQLERTLEQRCRELS
ncbi:MAG: HipA domain-containing protein [Polyangiaceae bacterium]